MSYFASIPEPAGGAAAQPGQAIAMDIILPDGAEPSAAGMIEELFAAANALLPETPYEISVRHLSGQQAETPHYWSRRTVVFLGGIQARWALNPAGRKRVHQILRLAARPVLVGSAVFLLRETGMQNRYDVAVHRNFASAAAEELLRVPSAGATTAASGPLLSAVSGFAAIGLLLEMIGSDHGQFLAQSLRSYLGLEAENSSPQCRVALDLRRRAGGDRLIDSCLDLMQNHIEDPMMICGLARHLGVSTRKLQRRFLERTGAGPLVAYRALRVEQARQLLEFTSLPLPEVAAATGFGTLSNLTHWFSKEYAATPQAVRKGAFGVA